MPTVYRVGLVGCGRMGATIDDEVSDRPDAAIFLPYSHAAAAVACERTQLVAVADVVEQRVAETRARYAVPKGYTDYRDLIGEEQIDILCVATRPATHVEIVRCACERGVPAVYCEKPLCCSLEAADEMVQAVNHSGVVFAYGAQRRYAPLYRAARAWVDAGRLGQVQSVIAHFGAGSALWTHTHTADMLLFFAGDPEVNWVQGESGWRESDWGETGLVIDPPVYAALVGFQNGVRGHLTGGTGSEIEIVGSVGRLRTENNGWSLRSWRRAAGGRWEVEEPPPHQPESGTVCGLRALALALDGGPPPSGSIELARRGLELLWGVVESHRLEGRRVRLPLPRRGLRIQPAGW